MHPSLIDLPSCTLRRRFDLPPTPGNPRNSEGDFILSGDKILFFWSRFEGTSPADHAKASIWCRELETDGSPRGEARLAVSCEEDGAENIMSLSLLRMQNGDIGLFYFLRRNRGDGRLHLRRSADEGKTWSAPHPCTTGKGHYVTNNDRVVRLASSRLVVPAAYHRVLGEEQAHQYWDGRSSSYFFFSDDDGRTWREGNPVTLSAPASSSGLQEPGVFEYQPDCLYGWARTDLGAQYEMYSLDGGETWSSPAASRFSSPCSPLSMKRDKQGRCFAIWNPIPEYAGRGKIDHFWNGGRTPLVIAACDGRGHFGTPFLLEAEEDAGYCYTAMFPTERGFLLSYCAGQKSLGDASTLVRLRVSELSNEELQRIADAAPFPR